jgi:hypothetical protein
MVASSICFFVNEFRLNCHQKIQSYQLKPNYMKTNLKGSLRSLSLAMGLFIIAGFCSIQLSAQSPFNCTIGLGFTSGGFIRAQPHPEGGFMVLGYGNTWDQGAKTILIRVAEGGDTLWTKTYYRYGNLANRGPVDIAAAADGTGYLVLIWHAVSQYGNPVGNSLLKVDLEGDSLWQVAVSEFPDWGSSNLRTVKATADGGCIIAGANAWNNARVLKKISPTGTIEWINQSLQDIYPYYSNAVSGPGKTYFAVGRASGWQPTGENDSKIAVLKTDSLGATIWEKTFNSGHIYSGDSIRSEGRDVVALSDGGCIISARISNKGTFYGPAYLMRLDANGDTVWTKKYYNTTYAQRTAHKIEPTLDGNFLVYTDIASSSAQGRLIKINHNGDSLWAQYGYNYWMGMSGLCADGSAIFTGGHDSYGFFIKTSQDGMHLGPNLNLPWNGQTNLGGPTHFLWDDQGAQQFTTAYQLQLATDEAFTSIVVDELNIEENEFDVYNLTSYTTYYWRTRAFGPEGGHGLWSGVRHFVTGEIVGIDESNAMAAFTVSQNYPNPASNFTTIILNMNQENDTEIQISDAAGRVLHFQSEHFTAGRHTIKLDIGHLKAGIYFYTVKTNSGKMTKVMSVIR